MVDRPNNVRCPLADTAFIKTPGGIPEQMLVLMADIFPTGYFAASRFLKNLNQCGRDEYTAVVVGCGLVGICAITCALTMVKTVMRLTPCRSVWHKRRKLAPKLSI
jgi:threonine dehydrogenase-like Zn-dependent dehydrogenase